MPAIIRVGDRVKVTSPDLTIPNSEMYHDMVGTVAKIDRYEPYLEMDMYYVDFGEPVPHGHNGGMGKNKKSIRLFFDYELTKMEG